MPGPAWKGFALLAGACAALAISHDHFVVVLACAAAMLLVGVVWPVLAMADVRLSVTSARVRVGVGSEARLRLSIGRRWLPLAAAGVSWNLRAGLRAERAPRSLPARPATIDLTVRAERRGVYSIADIEAETSAPFGLVLATRRVRSDAQLIVWPAATEVDAARLAQVVSSSPAAEAIIDHGTGDGDVSGLRPYRRGDALRAVSWRQTARFGQVIVRERSGASSRRALHATLDTCAAHYDEDGREESFERAVSLFAGLVDACLRDGVMLYARIDAAQFVLAEPSGRAAILDALAAVSLQPGSPTMARGRGLIVGPRGLPGSEGPARGSSRTNVAAPAPAVYAAGGTGR